MPPAMRQQLKEILVEALGSGSAAARLTDESPAARAQRKRLFLLFKCVGACWGRGAGAVDSHDGRAACPHIRHWGLHSRQA